MHDYSRLVNQCQSPAQRRYKYNFLKLFGLNQKERYRLMDWNWSKIQGYVCQQDTQNAEAIKSLIEDAYELWKDEINATEREYYQEEVKG
jgi:hypothetical protein